MARECCTVLETINDSGCFCPASLSEGPTESILSFALEDGALADLIEKAIDVSSSSQSFLEAVCKVDTINQNQNDSRICNQD